MKLIVVIFRSNSRSIIVTGQHRAITTTFSVSADIMINIAFLSVV